MSDSKHRAVPDTSKITHDMATTFLAEALMTGSASFPVERQEAQGQRDLVESTQLPVKGSPGHGRDPGCDEAWAAAGIKFGPVNPKEIFRDAEIPAGWKVRPTSHPMWSDLVDGRGRPRAKIFYKAAFYDRSAHMDVLPRFAVRKNLDHYDDEDYSATMCRTPLRFDVLDGGAVRWSTRTVYIPPRPKGEDRSALSAWYQEEDRVLKGLQAEAEAWLTENGYPSWRSAAMYWDAD